MFIVTRLQFYCLNLMIRKFTHLLFLLFTYLSSVSYEVELQMRVKNYGIYFIISGDKNRGKKAEF